jgi:hypothetical protein
VGKVDREDGELDSVTQHSQFEDIFRTFVEEFGGEVLPEPCDVKTADYLFRKQNIVAELKCLVQDQTEKINRKLNPVVNNWIKKNGRNPPGWFENGKYIIEIRDAPTEIRDAWLNMLVTSLSDLIAEANRQIRATIQREKLTNAKGMVLIFNEGNVLHSRPEDYKQLLVHVVTKKATGGKGRRFPYIHAAIYFSFETIKHPTQNMSFWAGIQIQVSQDDNVTPIRQFQKELQQAWYLYIEKTTGRIVRNHPQ